MFEDVTFEDLLNKKLSQVPDTFDTRQNTIMYHVLAPNSAETAKVYTDMALLEDRLYADTATGEDLDKCCAERNKYRKPASNAIRKGIFRDNRGMPFNVDIAKRFRADTLLFTVLEKIAEGEYQLKCETTGSIGNNYIGLIIPVDYIDGLATAEITDILIPGDDTENDASLLNKYEESFNIQSYGGNIADYKRMIAEEVSGVAGVKVIPVWNGGGTVKLVIIDSTYSVPSSILIDSVQEQIDPLTNQGKGLGLAPIGHIVTVEGVSTNELNIASQFTLQDGYTFEGIVSNLKSVIGTYFKELAKEWQNSNELIVRISQIETRFLNVNGVVDIQNTSINGLKQNYVLDSKAIPTIGSVTSV